jgi:hypothetical protein
VKFLLAIVLLFSITPVVSGVIEAAIDLVGHADPHHAGELGGGCGRACTEAPTGCECDPPISTQAATASPDDASVTNLDLLALLTIGGRASEPPPLRPPIA